MQNNIDQIRDQAILNQNVQPQSIQFADQESLNGSYA